MSDLNDRLRRDLSEEQRMLLALLSNQFARDRAARDAWDREREKLVTLLRRTLSSGVTQNQVARALPVNPHTVKTWLRRGGYGRWPGSPRRPSQ